MQTDSFIRRVIRERFRATTVITIAHRLSSAGLTPPDYTRRGSTLSRLIVISDQSRVSVGTEALRSTVADYDRVVVMNQGKIVGQGDPHDLLQTRGLFHDMVQHTGKTPNP